jgi:multiple sugar transport system substrate-binding protein
MNQIDIAPLPAGSAGSVSGLGGWNYFINAFAPEESQNAAWEFVQYMVAEKQQKEFAIKGSYLPTLESLYDDPEVRLAPEALANTVPRPVSPVYSDMSLEMAEQFNASLKGDASPEEAIGTLQEQLQSIAEQAPS